MAKEITVYHVLIAVIGIGVVIFAIYTMRLDHFSRQGQAALRDKDYYKAARAFTRIILLNPRSGPAYVSRGLASESLGMLDQAKADFDKALQFDLATNWKVWAYYGRGAVHLKELEFEKSLIDLNKAIELDSNLIALYAIRARVYFQQNDYKAYVADYDKLIYLDPQNAACLYSDRGYGQSLKGDFEKALLDCNEAIRLDPQLMYAYGSRGHTYFLMGKYAEALADFKKQAELKPDHKFAIAGMAVTYRALGQMDEAKQLWQLLITMDEKYRAAEAFRDEYQAAEPLIEEARKLITSLES